MPHAGTVARLERTSDDRLTSWAYGEQGPPTLVVENTQTTFDEAPVQTGQAAGRVEENVQLVSTGVDGDGPWIDVTHDTKLQMLATDFVADVTGSGLVIASSVGADDETEPFPFDLFGARCGADCPRLAFDIRQLSSAWLDDDVLTGVWMVARESDDGEGTTIDYGESARLRDVDQATIGLGFKRSFQGSGTKGVVFASGYCAAWRDWPASKFVRFVEHELLPFAYEYEPEDAAAQVDFDSFGGGS